MNNNENNIPNISNNQNIEPLPVDQSNVSSLSVAPPSVGNNNLNYNEEDGKILVPIGEQSTNSIMPPEPVIEETPNEVSNPVPISNDSIANSEDSGIMENKKMEKIEIEYTPPSGFKKFVMVFMFVLILAAIIFMPEINKFVENMKKDDTLPITEEQITDGILTCSYQTNNDKMDLIYSGEFRFSNRQLKSLTYTLTSRGDQVLDSTTLDTMYNSCKSLSTELIEKSIGVKVSCDLSGGTIRIDESINYSELDSDEATSLFKKYSIELADFEENQDIGDIENNLKKANYTCIMEAKSN